MRNYGTLLFGFAILVSCSTPKPECVNTEKYFDSHSYNSYDYQNRLITILQHDKPEDYRYFFITFIGEEKDTLVVNMRSEKNCFDAKILVTDWSKLAGMRKLNGKSYPKELHNLTWTLTQTDGKWFILYKDMDTIRD